LGVDERLMRILLNGKEEDVPVGTSLSSLLQRFQIQGRVAIEVNREIIRRARHEEYRLGEGDRVEVVTFVGGG
jgi:thiamine biosynthesis protein ThiS